jgi:hypothetical protein
MSTNPVVQAIKSGQAPKMAKLAAARGVLPLAPEETLEVLIALNGDDDDDVRSAVASSLGGFTSAKLRPILDNPDLPSEVVGFLACWRGLPRELFQPVILHNAVPDDALAVLAGSTEWGDVLELISLKQQSLIRNPQIIEAILANPRRTPEADRRTREIREEFFEKEFGAQMVAEELRASEAAAPVREETIFYEDLAGFIEADLIDTGDALLEEFEREFGPVEEEEERVALLRDAPDMPSDLTPDILARLLAEPVASMKQQPLADAAAYIEQGPLDFAALFGEDAGIEMLEELEPERIPVLARIMRMSVKDRIRFALKGTREVRMILVRDANRLVASAAINNPRITDSEVETIASLKSVHEEVLRLIGQNRAWARSYNVIHNLARNPKTPVFLSLNFLNRLHNRDLRLLAHNKNIPELVRTMAGRVLVKRQNG